MIAALLAVGSAHALDPLPTCTELAASYSTQNRVRPEVLPRLWWIVDDPPCAPGTRHSGAPPPEGDDLWCEDGRGRRTGPRTTFDATNGHVRSESTWGRDREIGPRIEWDTERNVVSRVSNFDDDGQLGGETIEWGADGSVTVTEYARGHKEGVTWRVDERGTVVLAEQWRGGLRNGRSCMWRDGRVDVDQVWAAGEPAPSGS
jgi:hypothetical protein